MFNTWSAPLTSDQFFSIVILSYTRPRYLKNLLQSIHSNLDMPVEIIVHDDASGRDLEVEIFNECRHMCSSLIFGSPERINMGMAASANRAIALANSKYVLLLNDDTQVLRPPFQKLKRVLDVPYVGCFGPWQTANNVVPGSVNPSQQAPITSNGVDFHLSTLPNGAGIFAFRRDIWVEAGGFPQVYTNAGDTCFMIAALKQGYFNGSMYINDEEYFTNVDQMAGYEDPTAGKSPLDASYPHVFGVANLPEICERRRHQIHEFSHHHYYAPEGIVAHTWWHENFFVKAYDQEKHTFDWEFLQKWGHARWQNEVERDLAAWRSKKHG